MIVGSSVGGGVGSGVLLCPGMAFAVSSALLSLVSMTISAFRAMPTRNSFAPSSVAVSVHDVVIVHDIFDDEVAEFEPVLPLSCCDDTEEVVDAATVGSDDGCGTSSSTRLLIDQFVGGPNSCGHKQSIRSRNL